MLRKTLVVLMSMALSFIVAPTVSNAAYPERPVKMIVGWGAGGGADLVIRLVEKEFQQEFGQPLVFVYKTGANGGIAATEVKDSKADGYTLASHCNPHMASNLITKKGRYNLDDFTYIAQTAKDPVFLAVRKDSPINSLDDFIKAATSGNLLVGCIDFYGPTNFAALKLHKMGVPYVMSSFGGGPKAISALLGGHVDAAFLITGTSMSSLSEMKPLALASEKRDPNMPDVPTFKELGYDIENSLSRFWMAPRDLPADVEARLLQGLTNIYKDEGLRERCAKAGLAVDFLSGPELKKSIVDSQAELSSLIEYGETLKKANQ